MSFLYTIRQTDRTSTLIVLKNFIFNIKYLIFIDIINMYLQNTQERMMIYLSLITKNFWMREYLLQILLLILWNITPINIWAKNTYITIHLLIPA